MRTYDTIVLGMGGMGSATAYYLAKAGKKVLGLERFDIPNCMGSSHGQARIFRLSQFAGSVYVPLAIRALELWEDLEARSEEKLLYKTGGLDCGSEGGEFINAAIKSCRDHQLNYELWNSKDLSSRYPAIQLPPDYLALYQPDAGFLDPERCITAFVNLAFSHGAEIHAHEQIVDWKAGKSSVSVTTNRATYEAETIVFAPGAWAAKVLPILAPYMHIERAVAAWFQPLKPELFKLGKLPIFIIEDQGDGCYGFPMFGRPGFRAGTFRDPSPPIDPDQVDRQIKPVDEQHIRKFVEKFLPLGAGEMVAAETCLYEFSADEHFIIDVHPEYPNVSFAAGFSSYGYKFCTAVGEIMAQMAMNGQKPRSVSNFALDRFAKAVLKK